MPNTYPRAVSGGGPPLKFHETRDDLSHQVWREFALSGSVPLADQQVEAHQVGECSVTERLGRPVPADLDETVGPGNLL